MRFCPSYQIVQLMREGKKAQEACNIAVEQMLSQSGQQFEVAVIALDTKVSVCREHEGCMAFVTPTPKGTCVRGLRSII